MLMKMPESVEWTACCGDHGQDVARGSLRLSQVHSGELSMTIPRTFLRSLADSSTLPPLVNVSGQGEVKAMPDIAYVNLGV